MERKLKLKLSIDQLKGLAIGASLLMYQGSDVVRTKVQNVTEKHMQVMVEGVSLDYSLEVAEKVFFLLAPTTKYGFSAKHKEFLEKGPFPVDVMAKVLSVQSEWTYSYITRSLKRFS